MLTLPPLALYIHIPWCEKKCPYCDFNSHTQQAPLPEATYVDKLLIDLQNQLPFAAGRPLQSIFIGGGTPSLFSASSIDRLLSGVEKRIPFTQDIEITMEANPSSSESNKFADLKAAGVNRLSIGVQSFHDEALQHLGRIHRSSQAKMAVLAARKAGFTRINIDLMHGLPNQSLSHALNDLSIAVSLEPAHISWYQLTIEPNTEFYKAPPVLPSDDARADIHDAGLAFLEENRFAQYEISAFAQPSEASRHNLNYWEFGDYLAIGAGAHGKITGQDKSIQRYQQTRLPKDYLSKDHHASLKVTPLETEDALFEALLNGLRLKAGVSRKLLLERTFASRDLLESKIRTAQEKQLLQNHPTRLMATNRGFRYLNDLLALLL